MPYIKHQVQKNTRASQSLVLKLLTIEGTLPVIKNVVKELIKK